LPDQESPPGRSGLAWKLIVAFVIGAVLSGVIVAVVVHKSGPPAKPSAGGAGGVGIAMGEATGVSCGAPVPPGPAHPKPLLSQVFNVTGGTTPYQLGWSIVPFEGTGRTYRVGTGANLLALEPATGGIPLGFGTGTVTFGANPEVGTINAVIKLKTGHDLAVTGAWHCVPAGSVGTTTTTLPTAPT
jgi:hypothetical protein